MSAFILLWIESEDEAQTLVQDIKEYPTSPLLSPVQENAVYASVEVVAAEGAWASGWSQAS